MTVESFNAIDLIPINDSQLRIFRGEISGSILYPIGRPVPLIN